MSDKTVIRFKYLKPMGLSLDGHGNFSPARRTVLKQVGGVIGNIPVEEYDFNEVFEVELESEVIRELPRHVSEHQDEQVRNAYRIRQAEAAAAAHEANNRKRDELRSWEDKGYIKIISDSFLDRINGEAQEDASASKRGRGRPRKEPATA